MERENIKLRDLEGQYHLGENSSCSQREVKKNHCGGIKRKIHKRETRHLNRKLFMRIVQINALGNGGRYKGGK